MIAAILPREGKMKRKTFLLICAVLIAALLIGILAACDPGSKEQGGSQTPGGTTTPGDDGLGGDVGSVVTSPDGIVFTNIGGSYSVTGYEGTDTEVIIPETYRGLPVTVIAENAFAGQSTVTSVTIQDGVTSIGGSAFSGCISLTSITIPNSVTSIGGHAFSDCDNLQCNEYGNALYLGSDENPYLVLIKAKSKSISSAGVYESARFIYQSAFTGCRYLASITIPDSVTSIGQRAFSGCTSLISITIPDGVTSVDDNTFSGCTSLASVSIPDSVASVGENAFEGCTNIASVTIPSLAINDIPQDNLKTVVITSGDTIAEGAFSGCTTLTSVTISDGVKSIGENAFSSCASLISIVMGSGVVSIGDSAFENCTALESVVIPDSVTSVGSTAFNGCSAITSVSMPTLAIDRIPQDNLKTVAITSGESIENNAFNNCDSLTSVTISDSVTSIAEGAFSGCSSLESMTIPFVGATKEGTSKTHFGYIFGPSNWLYNDDNVPASLKEVVVTGGEAIDDYAFYRCASLTSITIPDSVTDIGYSAFYNCTSLEAVHITDIGKWAAIEFGDSYANPLYYAENLYLNGELVTGELIIPDGVASIGRYAFDGYDRLTSVTIGNGVTSIGGSAF